MKPEEKLSRDIRHLIEMVGGYVYSSEQGYRKERGGTRTDRGIPDWSVFVGHHFTFVELKAGKNKPNLAQAGFGSRCNRAGIPWQVWRSVFDCKSWLMEIGVVEDDRESEPAR